MKVRLGYIVAAAALAMSSTAGAATLQFLSNTGNSSLFFTSFDEAAGRSYFSELVANAGSTTTGVVRMDDIINNLTGTWTFTLSGLSGFYGSSTVTNILAGIGAGDSTGTGAFSQRRVLTSVGSGGDTPSGVTSSAVVTAATNLDNWHQSYQGTGAGLCDASPCTATSPSDLSYGGNSNWGANWGNVTTIPLVTQLSATGDAAWDLYRMTSGTTGLSAATIVRVGELVASLNLATNTLTISGGGPIPEVPLPAAVWLLGSALIGVFGIGRRRKSEAETTAVPA